ncbi:hypothetical protein [Yinghuangia sp. YIM S10712]|uniref:hypothetical protein n=1 Tax=Yinghuangia sp. YIM S10712 TaxID=3436930 RepID=UPI003F53CC79
MQLPYPALFYGHDAGAYTLPAELLHARETFRKVEAMPYPKPPRNAEETIHDFAAATVEALHHGTELPDPAMIEDARTAERAYQDAFDAMRICFDRAASRVRAAADHLDIIVNHLAPALDETWQTFQDAYVILRGYGETEHRRLLNAPAKVRKAADTVDRAVERYRLVRAGRDALPLRCSDDPQNKYASIRNFHTLHPTRLLTARTAWHDLDTRRYLAWMADHGGEIWMPTPDQQAQAVRDEAHSTHARLPRSRVAT